MHDYIDENRFGSTGDSIHDSSGGATTGPITAPYADSSNCWARLPCGICRYTMQHCPLHVQPITITCEA